MTIKQKRVCVFAHYDQDNKIDEYVYYYLRELLIVAEKLVFVTVSDISFEDIQRLNNLNIDVIKRENIGYDFYSYKVGIESFDISDFDELILCNDSVYGPLFPMKTIIDKMENKKCDFWGITEGFKIHRHLQSYFVVYKKRVFDSSSFKDFWKNMKVLGDKDLIVERYEIGLSKLLLENGLQMATFNNYQINVQDNIRFYLKEFLKQPNKKILNFLASPMRYFKAMSRENVNATLTFWKKLLLEHQMPFVKTYHFKVSTDRENELQILQNAIEQTSDYPFSLIANHLSRVCSK